MESNSSLRCVCNKETQICKDTQLGKANDCRRGYTGLIVHLTLIVKAVLPVQLLICLPACVEFCRRETGSEENGSLCVINTTMCPCHRNHDPSGICGASAKT